MKKTKDLKEEALESMKAIGAAPVEAGAPPSPVQALLGSIAAGVIAVILYKFTTTIEAALNRQAVSDNFSVGAAFSFLAVFFFFLILYSFSLQVLWVYLVFEFVLLCSILLILINNYN